MDLQYILSRPATSFVATSCCGWHTWVQPDKLLDCLQGRGWIFGNLRTSTVHLGPPGYCHFFNFTMICWHPHTGEMKCAVLSCLYLQLSFHFSSFHQERSYLISVSCYWQKRRIWLSKRMKHVAGDSPRASIASILRLAFSVITEFQFEFLQFWTKRLCCGLFAQIRKILQRNCLSNGTCQTIQSPLQLSVPIQWAELRLTF